MVNFPVSVIITGHILLVAATIAAKDLLNDFVINIHPLKRASGRVYLGMRLESSSVICKKPIICIGQSSINKFPFQVPTVINRYLRQTKMTHDDY